METIVTSNRKEAERETEAREGKEEFFLLLLFFFRSEESGEFRIGELNNWKELGGYPCTCPSLGAVTWIAYGVVVIFMCSRCIVRVYTV